MVNKIEIDIKRLEELERLASIAQLTENSILILDSTGKIEWVNAAFERLHGDGFNSDEKSLVNESAAFIKILNETDSKFFQTNTSFGFSRPITNKVGLPKWIFSTLTPLKDKNNRVERFIVIEADITKQKEVEEELVQRWENTQTVTEHLESVKDYIEEQIEELSEQKKALEIAKEKSEEVLNKVLPYEVANQLKKKGYATPRHYKKVTLLNLNIRNFFKLIDTIAIEDLVQQLHECFVGFDTLLENHYVEKIKTAGGNYIGAGGVPLRNRSNPIDVVLSALEIQENMAVINKNRVEQQLPPFIMGIGIHTGKVIAGVVGKNKLTYDIWGDTVNVAATIEHNIPEGKIYISETTFEEIKEFFDIDIKEKIILESAEEIKLFEVKKIKDKFAANAKGILPNEAFMHILSKL
jgi:PAS domain S-box-containing protein